MSFVADLRRAFWPNPQTRAEAARLYAEGLELRDVLERFPNEVISVSGGTSRGAARRAIYAHWALLQERVGEPDIDPDDRAAVERVIREEGHEIAQCRTGSALTSYRADFPEMGRFPALAWWASQAPPAWRAESRSLKAVRRGLRAHRGGGQLRERLTDAVRTELDSGTWRAEISRPSRAEP